MRLNGSLLFPQNSSGTQPPNFSSYNNSRKFIASRLVLERMQQLNEESENEYLLERRPSRSSSFEVTERRKWVEEEDDQLTSLVNKYGTKNWRVIASHLPGRLPKQCRERWINHVDPAIRKGRLTEHDWFLVLQAQKEHGNRWSEIAKCLPGRTPNQIKNHWHAMMRKKSNKTRRDGFEVDGSETEGLDESECAEWSGYDDGDDYDDTSPRWEKRRRSSCELSQETKSDFEYLCDMVEVLYSLECDQLMDGTSEQETK